MPVPFQDSLHGMLLGTAVGDAIGLPREGLSRRRAMRWFGAPPYEHRLFFGRGMISDDTEHTFLSAQALIASHGDASRFARSLAWRLRGWLLGVPAGVGSATLRALCKLWIGFPPARSGVRSAGNGPAMRAAILGVYADEDTARLRALVEASTRLTHTDLRAEEGARVIALAARAGARDGNAVNVARLIDELGENITGEELRAQLARLQPALSAGWSAEQFADAMGLARGVTGYVNHTVPVAMYCWLRHRDDFRASVEAAVQLGGDSDTVGAIVGALSGATLGPSAIPGTWVAGLAEWPRSKAWLAGLAARLADARRNPAARPCGLFWPGLILRNGFFLAVVLAHGFRRLAPPY